MMTQMQSQEEIIDNILDEQIALPKLRNIWQNKTQEQQLSIILNLIALTQQEIIRERLSRITKAIQLSNIWGIGLNQQFITAVLILTTKVKNPTCIKPIIQFYLKMATNGQYSEKLKTTSSKEDPQNISNQSQRATKERLLLKWNSPIKNSTVKQMSKELLLYILPISTLQQFHDIWLLFFYISKNITAIIPQTVQLMSKSILDYVKSRPLKDRGNEIKQIQLQLQQMMCVQLLRLLKGMNKRYSSLVKLQMSLLSLLCMLCEIKSCKFICEYLNKQETMYYFHRQVQQYRQELFKWLSLAYVRFGYVQIYKLILKIAQSQINTIMITDAIQLLSINNYPYDINMLSNIKTILTILQKKHYKSKKICEFEQQNAVLSKQINYLPCVLIIKMCINPNIHSQESIILQIVTQQFTNIQIIYAKEQKLLLMRKIHKQQKEQRILASDTTQIKYRFGIQMTKNTVTVYFTDKPSSFNIKSKPKYLKIGNHDGLSGVSVIHNMYLHEKITYKEYGQKYKTLDENKSMFQLQSTSKLQLIKKNIHIKYSPSYPQYIGRLGGHKLLLSLVVQAIQNNIKHNILNAYVQLIHKQYMLVQEQFGQQNLFIYYICRLCIVRKYPASICIGMSNFIQKVQYRLEIYCKLLVIAFSEQIYSQLDNQLYALKWEQGIKILQQFQRYYIFTQLYHNNINQKGEKQGPTIKNIKKLYELCRQYYSKGQIVKVNVLLVMYHSLLKVYLLIINCDNIYDNSNIIIQLLNQNYDLVQILKRKLMVEKVRAKQSETHIQQVLDKTLLLFHSLQSNTINHASNKKNRIANKKRHQLYNNSKLKIIMTNIYKQAAQLLYINNKDNYYDIVMVTKELSTSYTWSQQPQSLSHILNIYEALWNYCTTLLKNQNFKNLRQYLQLYALLSQINLPLNNKDILYRILNMYIQGMVKFISPNILINICQSMGKQEYYNYIIDVISQITGQRREYFKRATHLLISGTYPLYWTQVNKLYAIIKEQSQYLYEYCRMCFLCKQILEVNEIIQPISCRDILQSLVYFKNNQSHNNSNVLSSKVQQTELTQILAELYNIKAKGNDNYITYMKALRKNEYYFSEMYQLLISELEKYKQAPKQKRQKDKDKYIYVPSKYYQPILTYYETVSTQIKINLSNINSNYDSQDYRNSLSFLQEFFNIKHKEISQLKEICINDIQTYNINNHINTNMEYALFEHETLYNAKFLLKKRYIENEKMPKHNPKREEQEMNLCKNIHKLLLQLLNQQKYTLFHYYKPSKSEESKQGVKNLYITNNKIYQGQLKYIQSSDKEMITFIQNINLSKTLYKKISALQSQQRTKRQIINGTKIIQIDIRNIAYIQPKCYLHLKIGLQIFTKHRSYFFTFTDSHRRKAFISKISFISCYHNDLLHDRLIDLQYDWNKGYISNFEYLMHVNNFASRSFNDPSQYYVFPWIITNFKEKFTPQFLSDSCNFRYLKYPIGKINPQRFKSYKLRYQQSKKYNDFNQEPFLYGSFYSNPAIVCNYLVRVSPFSQHHFNLQGNRFDLKDRLFTNFSSIYRSVQENFSDLKQLIPQFYYFPQLLRNRNCYKFSSLQKQPQKSIIFPNWVLTQTPQEFVFRMRKSLECDIVSQQLPSWIDLTFGYKSEYQTAFEYDNLYNSKLYPLEESPQQKQLKITILKQFGQVPLNVFKKSPSQKRQFEMPQNFQKSISINLKLQDLEIDKKENIIIQVCDELEIIHSSGIFFFRNLLTDTIQSEPSKIENISKMAIMKLLTDNGQNCFGVFLISNESIYVQKLQHEDSLAKNLMNMVRAKTKSNWRVYECVPFLQQSSTIIKQLEPCLLVSSCNIIRIFRNKHNASKLKSSKRKTIQKLNLSFVEEATFCKHKSKIIIIQVSKKLGLIVSIDQDNNTYIFTIHQSSFNIVSNFKVKEARVSQTIIKCLIHELGIILLYTSDQRLLVYNYYGDNILNVCFIGKKIGDIILWDQGSTSQIVIGTKNCRLYKFDIFDLGNEKSSTKSQLVVNLNNFDSLGLEGTEERIIKLNMDRVGRLWQLFIVLADGSIRVFRSNQDFPKEKGNKIQRDRCNKNYNYRNL